MKETTKKELLQESAKHFSGKLHKELVDMLDWVPTTHYMQTVGPMHCFTCHKEHPAIQDCPGEPSSCTPACGKWYNPFQDSTDDGKIGSLEITKIRDLLVVGESEGWDYFFGRRDACCPGDDYAAVYNLALKDFERALQDPDYVEMLKEKRAEEDEELDEIIENTILDEHDKK